MQRLAVVAVLGCLMTSAWAAPLSAHGHVPASTCADMVPVHGDAVPSDKPTPYVISVQPAAVSGGGILRVHISGDDFKGVYLQARLGDQPVGEFLLPVGETRALALSDCPPGHNNAFSYISHQSINSIDVDWRAPAITGEVVFRATVVKSFSEFWVGVESPKVVIGSTTKADNAVPAA